MNLEETKLVLRKVRTLCPAQRFDEYTLEHWYEALGDVPADLALEAVTELGRLGKQFMGPGDVRARAIREALPPSEYDAFTLCQRIACNGGHGRWTLPPALQQAYDAMGGAGGSLVEGGTTVRAQFRDVYRQISEKLTEKLMLMDARDVLEDHASRLAAIETAKEQKALEARDREAAEPQPASQEIVEARLSEMRATLDKIRRPA